MADAEYEVIVRWDELSRKTGAVTHFEVGDDYTGEAREELLNGVDDQGPLIRKKVKPVAPAISIDKEN